MVGSSRAVNVACPHTRTQCSVGIPVVCGDEPEGFNRSIYLLCGVLVDFYIGLEGTGRLDRYLLIEQPQEAGVGYL